MIKAKLSELFLELYPLVSGLLAMLLAQLLKMLFEYLKHKKINLRKMMNSGGMPSSHSAMVVGLTSAVGLKDGWTSTIFCVCVIFTLVVLYDAAGVRRAAGKQAGILNQMMDDFFERREIRYERLTELIGHTPLEVIAGALLGIVVAFSLYY